MKAPRPTVGVPLDKSKKLSSASWQLPAGMRVRDVHTRVELLLGERVSLGSVKATLNRLAKGDDPRFVRTRHGLYRLLAHDRVESE